MTTPITLTHARLRVQQGDLRTARRILRRILGARPDDVDARALLVECEAPAGAPSRDRGRTIERLERWRIRLLERSGA